MTIPFRGRREKGEEWREKGGQILNQCRPIQLIFKHSVFNEIFYSSTKVFKFMKINYFYVKSGAENLVMHFSERSLFIYGSVDKITGKGSIGFFRR